MQKYYKNMQENATYQIYPSDKIKKKEDGNI